jgi:hypothetical protein
VSAPARPTARRLVTLATATLVTSVTAPLLAGPASAGTPEGWETKPDIDGLFVLWVFVGLPILAALLIGLLVYLPAMIRGERLAPGPAPSEDQWLGGPRKTPDELAAPDTAESQAGGGSGRW